MACCIHNWKYCFNNVCMWSINKFLGGQQPRPTETFMFKLRGIALIDFRFIIITCLNISYRNEEKEKSNLISRLKCNSWRHVSMLLLLHTFHDLHRPFNIILENSRQFITFNWIYLRCAEKHSLALRSIHSFPETLIKIPADIHK